MKSQEKRIKKEIIKHTALTCTADFRLFLTHALQNQDAKHFVLIISTHRKQCSK